METWGYAYENKNLVSDDYAGRDKNSLLAWEPKEPTSFGNCFNVTNVEGIENHGFGGLSFPETSRKNWDVTSSITLANSNSEVDAKSLYTPITSLDVGVYYRDEPSLRFSNSFVVESGNRDLRDSLHFRSSKVGPIGSLVDSSSTPAKRGRASLNYQGAFCHVHGCKKDLSSSKEYHKRHKVCEIHSKSAKVVVNGIEQRFCQQCSRFHLLGEFDDDKRSCRKRLAGHNERRRKPQAGTHSGRAGNPVHSYIGSMSSRLQGSTVTTSPVISQEPQDPAELYLVNYNSNNSSRHRIHEEGEAICPPQEEITISNRNHNPMSVLSDRLDKSIPLFCVNEATTSSGLQGDLCETNSQNIHEKFIFFRSASAAQNLPGMSATALSLLSSQSRNSSRNSSGLSNKFTTPTGLFLAEEGNNNVDPNLISNNSNYAKYGDRMFRASCYMNKGEGGIDVATIDLIQLSSQLHRVENEKQYMKLNQDNNRL